MMLAANCPLAKQDRIKEILKVENIDVEKVFGPAHIKGENEQGQI
jgi:hypothetical protein